MKKLLATVLAIYIIAVGYVFVAGGLQKQSNDNEIARRPAPAQATANPSQSYTVAAVRQHHTLDSCWLIINNTVYDVTNFLSQHPGGANTILTYCGTEATRAFDTKDQSFGGGHSPNANSLLQDYLIGKITP
ncbi:MAG: cytochrome b5 domain-containing protein [Patescibacteria group bacterium]|nr:cytochrome b5 domain-containing protein [Patescibacteria group bacterium]